MSNPSPDTRGPLLGEVLLEHGVVDAEQLAVALKEQQQTGRPLGEIIVERGFAPGPIVAQALATQRGGMVKTEYGFATGFQAAGTRPAAPAQPDGDPRDTTITELKRVIASRDAEIERLQDLISQLRMQCVDAAKNRERLTEVERELRLLRAGYAAA
jgi:hypothetical protein